MKMTVSFPRSGLSLAFDAKAVQYLMKQSGASDPEKVGIAVTKAEKMANSVRLSLAVVKAGQAVGEAHVAQVTSQAGAQEYQWRCRWLPDRLSILSKMVANHGVIELDDGSWTTSKEGFILQYKTDDLPAPITRVHTKTQHQQPQNEVVNVVLTMPDGISHKFVIPQTEAFNLAMKWAAEGKTLKG